MTPMRIVATRGPYADLDVDVLVLGIAQGESLSGDVAQLDEALGGVLTRLLESAEFAAKLCDVLPLILPAGVRANQILLVGLGTRDELDRQAVARAAGAASRKLAGKARSRVAFVF